MWKQRLAASFASWYHCGKVKVDNGREGFWCEIRNYRSRRNRRNPRILYDKGWQGCHPDRQRQTPGSHAGKGTCRGENVGRHHRDHPGKSYGHGALWRAAGCGTGLRERIFPGGHHPFYSARGEAFHHRDPGVKHLRNRCENAGAVAKASGDGRLYLCLC